MKFESWLRKQKDRDEPIGDLAKDFIDSKTKTIKESFEKYSPCAGAKETYKEACQEYLSFIENKLKLFNDEDDEE